jgi:hypothetical protein
MLLDPNSIETAREEESVDSSVAKEIPNLQIFWQVKRRKRWDWLSRRLLALTSYSGTHLTRRWQEAKATRMTHMISHLLRLGLEMI